MRDFSMKLAKKILQWSLLLCVSFSMNAWPWNSAPVPTPKPVPAINDPIGAWGSTADQTLVGITNGIYQWVGEHPTSTALSAITLAAVASATALKWGSVKPKLAGLADFVANTYNKCPAVWKTLGCLAAATTLYAAYKNGLYPSPATQNAAIPVVKTVATSSATGLFANWLLKKEEPSNAPVKEQNLAMLIKEMTISSDVDNRRVIKALVSSYQDKGFEDLITDSDKGFLDRWKQRTAVFKENSTNLSVLVKNPKLYIANWQKRREAQEQLNKASQDVLKFIGASNLVKAKEIKAAS